MTAPLHHAHGRIDLVVVLAGATSPMAMAILADCNDGDARLLAIDDAIEIENAIKV
jgi:hypothetical protein